MDSIDDAVHFNASLHWIREQRLKRREQLVGFSAFEMYRAEFCKSYATLSAAPLADHVIEKEWYKLGAEPRQNYQERAAKAAREVHVAQAKELASTFGEPLRPLEQQQRAVQQLAARDKAQHRQIMLHAPPPPPSDVSHKLDAATSLANGGGTDSAPPKRRGGPGRKKKRRSSARDDSLKRARGAGSGGGGDRLSSGPALLSKEDAFPGELLEDRLDLLATEEQREAAEQKNRAIRLKTPDDQRRCRYCLGGMAADEKPASAAGSVAELNPLFSCGQCYRCYHGKCLGFAPETVRKVIDAPAWVCPVCKRCDVCDSADAQLDDMLLFCDLCDKGTHTFCCDPPLSELPTGDWRCNDCLKE